MSAPTPAPGLFGAAPAPATSGLGGFGSTAPAPEFGAKPGGLFGGTPTPGKLGPILV